MSANRLKHFGWGWEGESLSPGEEDSLLARYRQRFAVDRFDELSPPVLADIRLKDPRKWKSVLAENT